MTDLEKFQLVNRCETTEELRNVVLSFCDSYGNIKGRTRTFNGLKMASSIEAVVNNNYPANVLTREFGIRQQALYLAYYNK